MSGNNRQKQFVDKLTTMLSKPVPYFKTCVDCGQQFAVNQQDSELTRCLPCQVKADMHLSDDTIINHNILSLWKANRYGKDGIDPMLLAVAEGIFMMPNDVAVRDKQTHVFTLKRKFSNDDIEHKLRQLVKSCDGKFDAVLILRLSPTEDFTLFKVRLGSRVYKRLKGRSLLNIKQAIVSLIVHYVNK